MRVILGTLAVVIVALVTLITIAHGIDNKWSSGYVAGISGLGLALTFVVGICANSICSDTCDCDYCCDDDDEDEDEDDDTGTTPVEP